MVLHQNRLLSIYALSRSSRSLVGDHGAAASCFAARPGAATGLPDAAGHGAADAAEHGAADAAEHGAADAAEHGAAAGHGAAAEHGAAAGHGA